MNLNLIKSLLGDLDMSQKENNINIFLVEKIEIDIQNLNLASNGKLLKQIADISDDSALDKDLKLAESPTNDNE